ncbi:hypothetical protein [Streptomyces fulvoviolaceus]|uniref:hypothetical protein n=1 Tax=Streptomyces fulvoviolaceus TaxID=285535 RepID=UPI0021C0AAE8|nr:hypothetical protein [Streptomyces fulvoviolaceus]MCT9076855.1 hypothetical protein [Streptomyces fulvoviolaceus]
MSGGTSGEWYVVIEADYGLEHQWRLEKKIHVEGGREQTVARARELCLSHRDGGFFNEEHGRQVFRLSETSWLVELSKASWDEKSEESRVYPAGLLRISVAELETTREAPPAVPPPGRRSRWSRS